MGVPVKSFVDRYAIRPRSTKTRRIVSRRFSSRRSTPLWFWSFGRGVSLLLAALTSQITPLAEDHQSLPTVAQALYGSERVGPTGAHGLPFRGPVPARGD
jgi:hypothetical protein